MGETDTIEFSISIANTPSVKMQVQIFFKLLSLSPTVFFKVVKQRNLHGHICPLSPNTNVSTGSSETSPTAIIKIYGSFRVK